MGKKLKGTPDRVWLAGLGALVIAEQEGNDLFQQLVEQGKKIERTIEHRKTARSAHLQLELRKAQRIGVLLRNLKESEGKRESLFQRRYPGLILGELLGQKAIEAPQARRLASAKRAFLKEFGQLDKPAAGLDCERLRRERRIFILDHRNATYVPGFQFDEKGHPLPVIAKVIQILGKDTSDWGLALWFTAANGWLDGKRPVDLLKDDPEEVIQAAEQEAAELVF